VYRGVSSSVRVFSSAVHRNERVEQISSSMTPTGLVSSRNHTL
jgi:hypothetical protein